jgi:outer membrane lipoprotein
MKTPVGYLAAVALLIFAGCAHRGPEAIRLAEVQPVTVAQAKTTPEQFENVRVRWGGTLVNVENRERETLIEILSRSLDPNGYPDAAGSAGPRFLVRIAGFVDPAEYAADRLITVVGRINGTTTGHIGEYEYRYTLIDADVVHLWPITPPQPCCPLYSRYDPWYYPWYGPWYGSWYGPWWRTPYW